MSRSRNTLRAGNRRWTVALVCLFAAGLAWSSSALEGPRADELRKQFYERRVEFTNAVLYKPDEKTATEAALRLAPLLMCEITTNDASRSRELIVWFMTNAVTLNGRQYQQATYYWADAVDRSGASVRGVRMTLNAAAKAVIWEILDNDSGLRRLCVSASLEGKAFAQFQSVLPERKSALERAVFETPRVLVERVIGDGWMPMGPFVYLDKNGSIATVICRCMEPEARAVSSTQSYRLVTRNKKPTSREDTIRRLLREGESLDHILRLPKEF